MGYNDSHQWECLLADHDRLDQTMTSTLNPYHNGDPARLADAPFAGRQTALARVGALVSDAGRPNGVLFTGAQGMGKSALLHGISATLPPNFIGVIVPLRRADLRDETRWFMLLAEAVSQVLVERDFTLSRLSQIEPPGDDPRTWFETIFLPPIFGALRAHRRLIFLFDDAERLLHAVRDGALPPDTIAYLSRLLTRSPGLHLLLTLDDIYEADIPALIPLISFKDVMRLEPLEAEDVRWLLTAPIGEDAYRLSEEAITLAQMLTGGLPTVAQRLGFHLYDRWQSAPEVGLVTPVEVRSVQPTLYMRSDTEFRTLWERLTTNEQIVLTGMGGLYYADPLRRTTAESIQRRLLETEAPMDVTTIQAALRALEYQYVLTFAPEGAAVRSGLFMTWILENAQVRGRVRTSRGTASRPAERVPVSGTTTRRGSARPARPAPAVILRFLALALVVVLLANLIVFLLTGGGGTPPVTPPIVPTVTFVEPALTPLFSGAPGG